MVPVTPTSGHRSYERAFSDVLALQSEVAGAIAEGIKSRGIHGSRYAHALLCPGECGARGQRGVHEGPFRAIPGDAGGTSAPPSITTATALEADPTFAGAYVGLASTELMLAMSQPSDPTESLARARVMALKAFEMDQELPEVHDILALIDEQLGEELFSQPTAIDTAEPMSEVRIVRESPTESVGVGVGANAGDSITVISVDPSLVSRAGEFRRDSTRIFESYTQRGPATPGRVGRLGHPEREDVLGGVDPPGIGGPAAQRGGAHR